MKEEKRYGEGLGGGRENDIFTRTSSKSSEFLKALRPETEEKISDCVSADGKIELYSPICQQDLCH